MVNYLYHRNRHSKYNLLSKIAVLLALAVIMLGAYTRLSDAGLGCPDWPGCYGKLVLPKAQAKLVSAQQAFPNKLLETQKAWTEMAHRYLAGTLGLIILALGFWALFRKRLRADQPLLVPWLLVALVMVQALLGMWTVTLKLLPLVVMGHLMGGMTIVALLWWLNLATKQNRTLTNYPLRALRPWAVIGLLIVMIQVFLGAWTSTNYAALACPHFPFCRGTLFPHLYIKNAFDFLSPVGPNYEGGRLAMNARITIQMIHRYGAFLTAAYFIPLSLCLITIKEFSPFRKLGWLILFLLAVQIALGIINVELLLPMPSAVAHNGVAALLILSIVTVLYKLYAKRQWNPQ